MGKNRNSDPRTRGRKKAAMADASAETAELLDPIVDHSDTVPPPNRGRQTSDQVIKGQRQIKPTGMQRGEF